MLRTLPILSLAACSWLGPGTSSPSQPPPELQCAHDKSTHCFIHVEGGAFRMGAQSTDPAAPAYDPAAAPDEGPPRMVTVGAFWIQEYEFTFSDLRRCASGEAPTCPLGVPDPMMVRGEQGLSEFVAGVTWEEARAACASMGARLPTEVEWEFAARGPEGRRFPWGDAEPCGLGKPIDRFVEYPRDRWSQIEGCGGTAKPASPRGRSPFGMVDMAWGHWEWVSDWYADDAYASGAPSSGTRRVQRGGAWNLTDPLELRASARASMKPDTRATDVGFRCAW